MATLSSLVLPGDVLTDANTATLTNKTIGDDLKFADSDESNWVALQAASTVASDVTWTLPDADGTDGQFLKTNGSGTLSWATASGGGGGGGTSVTVTQATATASQTTFSVTYTVGQLSVYLNGALLASADYTATNGTSVVLASGAASGDIFTAVAYDSATQITQGDTAVEVSDTGSDGTITFDTDGSERMRINNAGNVGIGVTPSAWNSAQRALQVGATGVIYGTSGDVYFGNNIFVNSSDSNTYITTDEATVYRQVNNSHIWYGAASGTAGASITLTERMRINAGSNILCLAGGNTSATGTGITFPATQSASSDANTLDDYEEGTWTPTIAPNSGSFTSINYAPRLGYYVKIGKWVWVTAQWNIDGITVGTASGGITVTGIPFNASGGRWYTAGIGYSRDWTNAPLGVGIYGGQSYLTLFRSTGATGTGTGLVVSDLNTGAPNKNEFGFTIVYQTAS